MASSSPSVLLARQPIFDRHMQLFAYELLYRGEHPLASSMISGDSATCQVVMNALCGLNPDEMAGIPIFINLTEAMLVSDQTPPLAKTIAVFEILESVRASPLVLDKVRELKAEGFRLALDDFVWHDNWLPVLPLMEFIKIDIREHTQEALTELVFKLSPFKCQLLAEKVETREELAFCQTLGFHLFQGYFLEKPQPVVGKKISPRIDLIMNIYSALQNENVTAREVAEQISLDPQLTFQLLRIINSAAFARPRSVQTLREAVVLLGMQQLRTWIMVIALANDKSKPAELLQNLLVRAKLCELVAKKITPARADSAFLVGMFSGLDALLDMPIESVLSRLPLHDDVVDALLQRRGELGSLLSNAMAFQHAAWPTFSPAPLSAEVWQQCYFDALKWARAMQVPLRAH